MVDYTSLTESSISKHEIELYHLLAIYLDFLICERTFGSIHYRSLFRRWWTRVSIRSWISNLL